MVIDYDRNPNLTVDQKLQSLIESIMLALNEKGDEANLKRAKEDAISQAHADINSAIAQVRSDIDAALDQIDTDMQRLKVKAKSLTASVSVAGSGEGHTNLKSLIDADMPSGSTCLGIVGFTTNDQNIVPVSVRYVDGVYSLQLRNLSSTATTASVAIYYLYI